jgi:LPS export ABC transporter protein LptC
MNRTCTRSVAVVLALGVAVLAGCRSEEGNPAASDRSARPPSEGMRGISLQNFREGDTRWVLQADTASVFREQKRVEAEWVIIDFWDDEEHVSRLTADRGILQQNTDDLEARGNVRVTSEDGAVLKTEVLYWDHQASRIHTDAFVEITRDDDVLTGVGLTADPGLDRVELKQEVRGTVRGQGSEELLESEG